MRRIWIVWLVLLGAGGVPAWARFEPVTCKNSYAVAEEISEGGKAAAEVYRAMPVLSDADPVTVYVQRLGAKLVGRAPVMPGVGQQWPFSFHVVASADINAFALPGGAVFVNLGTVQAAETEAQLAGVMAHEISHVVMRHSTCNLSKQRKRSILYGIGAIGSAVVLGNGAAGALAQTGIGTVQGLDFLHMSRDYERQADLLGTGILYDSGYDPRGLPQFFETIQAKYGAGGAQLMSDHPNPGNRTEYVNAEIQTLPARSGSVVTTAEFKQVHALAKGEQALSAKEVQAGAWRRSGQYASGPGAGVGGVAGVSSPVGGGGAGSVGGRAGGSSGAAASDGAAAAPLSRAQMLVGGGTTSLRGARFAVRYSAGWTKSEDASGAVTLAPPGGSGGFGLAYGATIDVDKVAGNGVTDEASLRAAVSALVTRLVSQNPGLSQAGSAKAMLVDGKRANSVELRGQSPVVDGGARLPERDLLVAVARGDGDLSYVVFVAPERDFAQIKPAFDAMLASFQAQ